MIDRYAWAGGEEAMLRFGPDTGPVVVVALPLLEEANRTRAFAARICRLLADRGVASLLPDLPAQGDSLLPTERLALADLRAAFAAVVASVKRPAVSLAIRSGALLDSEAAVIGRWHLSPQTGAEARREWMRTVQATAREAGQRREDLAESDGDLVEIAGNPVPAALLAALAEAKPSGTDARTLRLEGDARPADGYLAGNPLWRRAEPGDDPALAAAVVDDLADWIATCAG